jgi:hypothetical protein
MSLIVIYHIDPVKTGGPLTAEIPPEALKDWEKHGWFIKPDNSLGQSEKLSAKDEAALPLPHTADDSLADSPLNDRQVDKILLPPEAIDLYNLTVKELKEYAKENNIQLPSGIATKIEIIEYINDFNNDINVK